MTKDELAIKVHAALNKLCKWRNFFVGWQLGTRTRDDAEAMAVRDHREVTIMMRAELNALTNALIKKELITIEQFNESLLQEAGFLDAAYQKSYPGFSTREDGLVMKMPAAADTMRVMNFRP